VIGEAGKRSAGAGAGAPPSRGGGPAANASAGLAQIARGSVLNLAGTVILGLSTVALTVVVTRWFTRPQAGAFFAATSLFLVLAAIAGLGASSGLVFFAARLRSVGEERRFPILLRAAVVPVATCSALAGVSLLVFAGPLARVLLDSSGAGGSADPGKLADALRALAVALPFAALTDAFLGASRGYHDMLATTVVDRIGRGCLQLVGVVVAAIAGTAALLAPLWALAYIPAAVGAWTWLRRIRIRSAATEGRRVESTSRVHANFVAARANAAGFWAYTAPRALATIAQRVIQRLDIVLVGVIRGPVEAAVYTAATRFLVVGQFVDTAVGMAAQPQFSRLFALRDRAAARAVYRATTGWVMILTWPLFLLAIVFGPELLNVFGHSYGAGTTVMAMLSFAMLVGSLCGQGDIVLTTTGRSGLSLANGLLAVVVNVALDLTLIPHYGITGAAIGWGAAILVSAVVPLAQVARIEGLHPFGPEALTASLLSLTSFGLIPLLVRTALGGGAAAALIAVVMGCVTFAAGLWRWRGPLALSGMLRRGEPPRPRAPQVPCR
jgi:O-antigen/teichoic acid export membrane protein